MSLHLQYDISVLFNDTKSAAKTWEKIMGSTALERKRQHRGIPCVWRLHLQAMPQEELDTRLVPTITNSAWISVDAGLTGYYQSAIQRFDGGLMDTIGEIVALFLKAGGMAVVLHKAAGCVKSADLFLREFNAAPGGPLPWIDFLNKNEETLWRTYGMPHYLGKPNIHAHSGFVDTFTAEQCFRATVRAALHGIDEDLAMPLWFEESLAIRWQAELNEEELAIHLRSHDLETQHPARTWPESNFEMYARMIADIVGEQFRPQFRFFDAIVVEGQIPCRVLCFEATNIILYVTAGFGRIAAPSGTEENSTRFAEFAAIGPSTGAIVRHLHTLANLVHESELPGGVQDYDILSPAPNLDGYIAMPMHDLPFGPQPIALRMLCPFYAFERPEIALDPPAWCDANLWQFTDIYDRWADAVSHEP